MPGVPLSFDRVMDYVNEYMKEPVPFKGMITVEAKADGSLPRKSNLLIMSPEEFCHAYLLAIDQAITRGDDENKLEMWKKFCLSVCFEYIDVSSEGQRATFWWSWNQREQTCTAADAIKRTAYQRACEVYSFKTTLDLQKLPSNAEVIAKMYSDAVSKKKHIDISFVRECLTVYDKVCLNHDITAVIDRLEKKFGTESCLNSLGKLQKIVEKCDTVQQRVLVFLAIEDAIESGQHTNAKFTREFLVGGHAHAGSSIPFVQLSIFKWRLRHHLLTIEMPREKLDAADLQKISEKTVDYMTYRREVHEETDSTWIGAMNPSSVMAFRLVQARRACNQ